MSFKRSNDQLYLISKYLLIFSYLTFSQGIALICVNISPDSEFSVFLKENQYESLLKVLIHIKRSPFNGY